MRGALESLLTPKASATHAPGTRALCVLFLCGGRPVTSCQLLEFSKVRPPHDFPAKHPSTLLVADLPITGPDEEGYGLERPEASLPSHRLGPKASV